VGEIQVRNRPKSSDKKFAQSFPSVLLFNPLLRLNSRKVRPINYLSDIGFKFSEDIKLANTASAKKRIRSSERRRVRNRLFRSTGRTHVKKARTLIAGGDAKAAQDAVRQAVSTLDKAAIRGVIHPRNAARRKSRLMRALAAANKA